MQRDISMNIRCHPNRITKLCFCAIEIDIMNVNICAIVIVLNNLKIYEICILSLRISVLVLNWLL